MRRVSGNRFSIPASALAALALAACASNATLPPVKAPGTAWREEPVIYNARRYLVAFAPAGGRRYRVRVRAPGRELGATAGDGVIIGEVAASTVGHFACRGSERARVVPSSPRPAAGRWRLVVRCG